MNHVIAPGINCRVPLLTLLTLRAGHPFRLPMHLELINVIGSRRLCLPTDIGTNGSNQLNPVLLLAGHKQVGIDKTSIDHVLFGQQCFGLQCRMNGLRLSHISLMGVRRDDMRDEMNLVFIAGFRQMHFVPSPCGGSLVAIANIRIKGESIRSLAGGKSLAARSRTWPSLTEN